MCLRSCIDSSRVRDVSDGVLIDIIVHPNSGRDGVLIDSDGIHVYVREPPRGGRANMAVVKLFKKRYGFRVEIVAGHHSRDKKVLVKGVDLATFMSMLCS